jgi:hypothetical protein
MSAESEVLTSNMEDHVPLLPIPVSPCLPGDKKGKLSTTGAAGKLSTSRTRISTSTTFSTPTATSSSTANRLPRYRRTPTLSECAVTSRDLNILSIVESFRLASSEHIQALVEGSNQGLLRRLQKLFHAGYLDRPFPRPKNGGGSSKMVYAITNRGVRLLQKEGRLERVTTTDWNAQNRELHEFSVRHTLLLSHIRAVLTVAARAHPELELASWREGRELQDSAEVAFDKGYARVPVAPDAFFTLKDAKGRAHFLVEADRGTMTVTRFTLKLQAYAAWWKEKKHEEKLGIRFFRVLTVTSSAERLANLVRAARSIEGVAALGRMFLFTHEGTLSLARPESVLEPIWTSLASQEPCSIVASVVQQPATEVKTHEPNPQNRGNR